MQGWLPAFQVKALKKTEGFVSLNGSKHFTLPLWSPITQSHFTPNHQLLCCEAALRPPSTGRNSA